MEANIYEISLLAWSDPNKPDPNKKQDNKNNQVAWEMQVTDCGLVERLVHERLQAFRSRRDREFFALPLKEAIALVSQIAAPYEVSAVSPAGANRTGTSNALPSHGLNVADQEGSVDGHRSSSELSQDLGAEGTPSVFEQHEDEPMRMRAVDRSAVAPDPRILKVIQGSGIDFRPGNVQRDRFVRFYGAVGQPNHSLNMGFSKRDGRFIADFVFKGPDADLNTRRRSEFCSRFGGVLKQTNLGTTFLRLHILEDESEKLVDIIRYYWSLDL